MQVFALLEKVKHGSLELLAIDLRPMVRVILLPFPANLQAFLDILALSGTQLLDFFGIREISDLLAALSYVASVRLWRRPSQSVFLALRTGEELGRLSKGMLDYVLRDAMVAEVDETGILETRKNSFSSGEFGFGACGGTGESGEVDERDLEGVVGDG